MLTCWVAAEAQTSSGGTRYAANSVLSSGTWVKIRVPEAGVYQLTRAYLSGLGFKNPEKVRLYGYNRPVLPETYIEHIEDDLVEIPLYRNTPSGTLLFYSHGATEWNKTPGHISPASFKHKNNPYSTYIYYFLTESGEGSPAEMPVQTYTGTALTSASTFIEHSLIEKDEYSFLNVGRTFFEDYDFATGPTRNYVVPVPGIANGEVYIEVQFGAAGRSTSTLSVKSGSNTLGTIPFTPLVDYLYADVRNKQFTLRNVVTEAFTLNLQHSRPAGVAGHLDYIRATYMRHLRLAGLKFLPFTANTSGTQRYGLGNANANTSVWCVTSPATTCELKGILKDSILTFSATASVSDKYVAVNTAQAFPAPQTVGRIRNQNLHALDSIDLVIIVPSSGRLTTQAQRLADAHTAKDSMRCLVVSADQIYNEFSSGTPDATAYRRFLKMLYDKAEAEGSYYNAPENLLLFGACYWDNRLVTNGMKSKSQDDLLLCYESDNSWSHTDSYVAEEYFALLKDASGVSPLAELPDVGVGRIPVSNVSDAKAVVDKLIAYMNNKNAAAWKNTLCFMADDGNNNVHMEDAQSVIDKTSALYPDFRYKRIYWDSYLREQSSTGNSYPAAYAEINRTMQDGALIMNYTGHGAPYCLSHEQVLKTADFQNWSSPYIPLWVIAACDVCPFDMNATNLSVEALLNRNGGAMGVIGTARTVYSSPNRTINTYFMKHVMERNAEGNSYTLGEALAQAKCDILNSKTTYSRLDTLNKAHFVLMGDPAISLITPEYRVKIDTFNGKPVSAAKQPVIQAGTTVTLTGHIEDKRGRLMSDFNGTVSPTVFDVEQLITCHDNEGKAPSPYTYKDRVNKLYQGNDSVSNGRFTFVVPVPLDISYADGTGLISLYAVNDDNTMEANGRFTDFILGSTDTEEHADTIGPEIKIGLYNGNSPAQNVLSDTPTIYATLSDESGINTSNSGVGHDIVAIIDGRESTTYSLNSYYKQDIGTYKSGSLSFTLPSLSEGHHTLTLRAFDTFNNPGTVSIEFDVVAGLEQQYEIFDISGRKFYNDDNTVLPPGIYIRRINYVSPSGTVSSTSEKFIIAH